MKAGESPGLKSWEKSQIEDSKWQMITSPIEQT